MPKTTNEAANAVTKATRLMPVASWAEPAPSAGALVSAAAVSTVDDAKVEMEVASEVASDAEVDADASRGADKVVLLIDMDVAWNAWKWFLQDKPKSRRRECSDHGSDGPCVLTHGGGFVVSVWFSEGLASTLRVDVEGRC